jgi:hypothetical protein
MKTNGNGKHAHGMSGEMFNEIKKTGKDLFGEASKLVKKTTNDIREKGLNEAIRENPAGAVLIGVGLGFFLSLFLRRRD